VIRVPCSRPHPLVERSDCVLRTREADHVGERAIRQLEPIHVWIALVGDDPGIEDRFLGPNFPNIFNIL
jgi:hypothetical protein